MSDNNNRRGNPLAVLAFALAAISMTLAVVTAMFAKNTLTQYEAQMEELASQNAALRQELESIEIPVATEAPVQQEMEAWLLEGTAWENSQGAEIYFKMTPAFHDENTEASLIVQLDSETAAYVSCQWQDGAFTASASLPALNGYTYLCSLDGQIYPLSSTNMWAVNLADSLTGYSSLVIQDWIAEEDLCLKSCYAQVCLPTLLPGEGWAECEEILLTLRLGDTVLESRSLTPEAGEAPNVLEMAVEEITFRLPELAEGDNLEIWLEAHLTDGRALESCGGSWYISEGQMQMVVG